MLEGSSEERKSQKGASVRFAARAIYVRFFLYRKERLSLLVAAPLPIASVTSGAAGESLTRLSYLFSFYFRHPFFGFDSGTDI